MDYLFFFLSFLSLIALILGLINPKIVLKWGDSEKRTRKKAFKLYAAVFVLFFILFAAVLPNSSPTASVNEIDQSNSDISSPEKISKSTDTLEIDEKIALEIDNKIIELGGIDKISLEQLDLINSISAKYNSLTSEQQNLVENYTLLDAAQKKVNYLKSEAEAAALAEVESEKQAAERAALEESIAKESQENMTEKDYKSLCIDYSYAEITKDENTYLNTYIKKDLMVRQIGTYTPTGETIYFCGEKSGSNSYVSGTFYVFDRRSDKSQPIELYDKIYIYGEVNQLQKVLTWDRNGIDPYIYAKYITFNGSFGE